LTYGLRYALLSLPLLYDTTSFAAPVLQTALRTPFHRSIC
jgi:hypothetical protein